MVHSGDVSYDRAWYRRPGHFRKSPSESHAICIFDGRSRALDNASAGLSTSRSRILIASEVPILAGATLTRVRATTRTQFTMRALVIWPPRAAPCLRHVLLPVSPRRVSRSSFKLDFRERQSCRRHFLSSFSMHSTPAFQ